jgi:serine/threonine protein kinase
VKITPAKGSRKGPRDRVPSEKPTEPEAGDDPVPLPDQLGEVQAQHSNSADAHPAASISSDSLERRILETTPAVKKWVEADYTTVKTLQLAQRNHGRVDLLRRLEDGCYVAAKRMPNKWVTNGASAFARQYPKSSELPWLDIGIVNYLNHRDCDFVCRCHGIFQDATDTHVLTTFCNGGDLFSWCERDPRPGPQREAVMRPLVAQLFSAVKHLHDFGIAHRDLSLENVLLHEPSQQPSQPQVKLIDFGMATTKRFVQNQVRGKLSYQAPEMHKDMAYDAFLSDVFALGVTVFSMAAHDYAWMATTPGGCKRFEYCGEHGLKKYLQNRKLRNGNGAYLSQIFSPDLAHLLEGLLAFDPSQRSSLGEAVYAADRSHTPATSDAWFGD